MSYNIEELEKAFGVHEGGENGGQPQQRYQAPQEESDEKVMDTNYITKVYDSFEREFKRVSAELQELEAKTNQKRLEFAKLQGAYELLIGFKRDLT